MAIPWFQIGLVLIYIIMIIVVSFLMTSVATPSDAKNEVLDKMRVITGVITALTAVMFGLSYIYIRSEPANFQTYTMVLLHLNIATSLISVGIASMQKLA